MDAFFQQKESRTFDTKDYPFMKGQKPEAETCYEEMQQHLRPRKAGKETKEAQQAEEESSEDDEPYEEIDDSYVSSKRESELEMNTEERKKADEVKTPTKNLSSNKSSSHNANWFFTNKPRKSGHRVTSGEQQEYLDFGSQRRRLHGF